jgi:tRNA 2-thiouridine synthesizing protein A
MGRGNLGQPSEETDAVTDHGPAGAAAPVSSIAEPRVVREVDAAGLSCPMPVIELAKAIDGVAIGELVGLTATDPAARVDVPVWCRMQRHMLRAMTDTDGSWRFVVERAR